MSGLARRAMHQFDQMRVRMRSRRTRRHVRLRTGRVLTTSTPMETASIGRTTADEDGGVMLVESVGANTPSFDEVAFDHNGRSGDAGRNGGVGTDRYIAGRDGGSYEDRRTSESVNEDGRINVGTSEDERISEGIIEDERINDGANNEDERINEGANEDERINEEANEDERINEEANEDERINEEANEDERISEGANEDERISEGANEDERINEGGRADVDIAGRDDGINEVRGAYVGAAHREQNGGRDEDMRRTNERETGRTDLLCEKTVIESKIVKLRRNLVNTRRRLRLAEERLDSITRSESRRGISQGGVTHSQKVSQSARMLAQMDVDEGIAELIQALSILDTFTTRLNIITTHVQRMCILEKVDAQVAFARPTSSSHRHIHHEYRHHVPGIVSKNVYDDGERQQDCVICFDPLTELSTLALPCAHVFHRLCINKWLKRSKVCPICKSKVR